MMGHRGVLNGQQARMRLAEGWAGTLRARSGKSHNPSGCVLPAKSGKLDDTVTAL